MTTTIAAALRHIDEVQNRLDNILAILQQTQSLNNRLAKELSEAHRRIETLQSERDTWRSMTGR